jgi:hypothetical protein
VCDVCVLQCLDDIVCVIRLPAVWSQCGRAAQPDLRPLGTPESQPDGPSNSPTAQNIVQHLQVNIVSYENE